MIKNYLSAIMILLGCVCSQAQAPTVSWAKQLGISQTNQVTSGGTATGVVVQNGFIYTVGSFRGMTTDLDTTSAVVLQLSSNNSDIGNSTDDVYVTKCDTNGIVWWARHLGGINNDYGMALAISNTGELYITGYFSGTADFDPGNGVEELTSAGGQDVFVVKLNTLGNYVWAKRLGGSGNDQGKAIQTDANGNVYIAGNFEGEADLDPDTAISNYTSAGNEDIYLVKLTSSGTLTWAKHFEGSNNDYVNAIAVDADNSIYITGMFNGALSLNPGNANGDLNTNGSYDAFLVKVNDAGNFQWAMSTGSSEGDDYGTGIATDDLLNIYITGFVAGTQSIGFSGQSFTPFGGRDIYVAKFNSLGTLAWVTPIGGAQDESGNAIAVDPQYNVYITGDFNGNLDFDPSAGSAIYTPAQATDAFVLKLNSSGQYSWVQPFGGTRGQEGNAIAATSYGDVIFAGTFSGGFNIGTTQLGVVGMGADAYMARLQQPVPATSIQQLDYYAISIYPNPSTTTVFINTDHAVSAVITNLMGETLLQLSLRSGINAIDTYELPAGLYLLQATNATPVRFIKQ